MTSEYDKQRDIANEGQRAAIFHAREEVKTPEMTIRITWASDDKEFWLHLSSPDGKAAGLNLGNPKGMIATALLRSAVGATFHRSTS